MRNVLAPLLLVSLLAACGSEPPPAPLPPPPAASPPAPTVVAAPEPAKPVEPTAEEKKKAADAKQLEEDRLKWAEDNKAEIARWTPELHAAAKALASKTFPSGKAAI